MREETLLTLGVTADEERMIAPLLVLQAAVAEDNQARVAERPIEQIGSSAPRSNLSDAAGHGSIS
jgi:hypothetical protein